MIQTFQADTQGQKNLVVNIASPYTVKIGIPQKNKKPKLIDIAFGDPNEIIEDLKSNGYKLTII